MFSCEWKTFFFVYVFGAPWYNIVRFFAAPNYNCSGEARTIDATLYCRNAWSPTKGLTLPGSHLKRTFLSCLCKRTIRLGIAVFFWTICKFIVRKNVNKEITYTNVCKMRSQSNLSVESQIEKCFPFYCSWSLQKGSVLFLIFFTLLAEQTSEISLKTPTFKAMTQELCCLELQLQRSHYNKLFGDPAPLRPKRIRVQLCLGSGVGKCVGPGEEVPVWMLGVVVRFW